MTSNARRSGFRLPWRSGTTDGDEPSGSSDGEEPEPESQPTTESKTTGNGVPEATSSETGQPKATDAGPAPGGDGASQTGDGAGAGSDGATAGATGGPPPPAEGQGPPAELLREMVEAMRGVAEQARVSSLADVRKGVEEAVASLRASGGERAAELRRRAEDDIAGVGEWAKAEAERIRREAESKVSGRRTQLEEQLKEQDGRTDREIESIRGRVTDYERQLTEFFDKLREISDPASFAAAVHRMPRPPSFDTQRAADEKPSGDGDAPGAGGDAPSAGGEAASGAGPPPSEAAAQEPANPQGGSGHANPGPTDSKAETTPVDATSTSAPSTDGNGETGPATDPGKGTTMIIVKGLGSFGAITAFKQSLERADGIGSVALALGPTGEFVYRATHEAGFDVQTAIAELEGGAAEFQRESDGTLRVSLAPR